MMHQSTPQPDTRQRPPPDQPRPAYRYNYEYTQPPQSAQPQQPSASATAELAKWSLGCGIAGFVCFGLPTIPAIICGHLALVQIKKSKGILKGRGLAITGLMLGYTLMAFFI